MALTELDPSRQFFEDEQNPLPESPQGSQEPLRWDNEKYGDYFYKCLGDVAFGD